MESDWKSNTLRNLATINYGQSPALILAEDGLYPVVGTGGDERLGNDYLHEGDSIILGRKGTIDRVYFATGRFWTIDTAYYLTNFTEVIPRWLYYFLQVIDLRQMNEATGVPSLSRELLYKIEIPTPPKAEQAKIAEILSTVDRAIEQTEALIDKQQRIKTGLMQDLLTRGIDEHGNLRSEHTHQFKDSMLGRIPVEWNCCSLRDVTNVKQGLQIAIEKRFKEEGPNRYIYITVQYLNNSDKYLEYIETPPVDLICNKDEILFTRTGNTGQIVFGVLGVFHNNFFKVNYNKQAVIKDYLILVLRWKPIQDRILDLAGTTTIPDLNHGDFYSLPILLPDLNEQKRIVEIVGVLNGKINNDGINLQKLHSLKTALMQDLLTGKKRITTLLKDREIV